MADSMVPKRQSTAITPDIVRNVDGLSALTTLVSATRDYAVLRQTETTKRAAIKADEAKQVALIAAAESQLRHYFDQVFAERAVTNRQMFDRLDQAMAAQDSPMVDSVVRGIVELAKASPLAGLDGFASFWSQIGTADNPIEL